MLRKDEIKTRVEMRYEIKSLETTNSLELAKNLSVIVLDEHFFCKYEVGKAVWDAFGSFGNQAIS